MEQLGVEAVGQGSRDSLLGSDGYKGPDMLLKGSGGRGAVGCHLGL